MFKITNGKGFHVTFDNNLTVSVQWGYGNYCENHTSFLDTPKIKRDSSYFTSNDAEIAVWDENDNWIIDKFTNKETDGMVLGYLTAEEVFEIIEKVRAY